MSPALVTAFPLTVPTVTGTRVPWLQTQGHLWTTEKGRGIHLGDSGPDALEPRDQGRHCPAAASSPHKTQKRGRSTHTLQPPWPSLRPTAEPAPASHLPLLLLRSGLRTVVTVASSTRVAKELRSPDSASSGGPRPWLGPGSGHKMHRARGGRVSLPSSSWCPAEGAPTILELAGAAVPPEASQARTRWNG